ncbi:MAG TPA: hypothetical protein VMW64_00850 [Dehalococcoidia bacterium]|nr:hypothetical protein [Dehalococcoidia bacterium]
MIEEIQLQEIKYYRPVKPPTLKQYLFRRAVAERMANIKGQTGVINNPESGKLIPISALAAKAALKGLSADKILQEHPEWEKDYERGIKEIKDYERKRDLHPR